MSTEKLDKKLFAKELLDQINAVRIKHQVEPLQMDKELTRDAQNYSNTLAKSGSLKHRSDHVYGENLAAVKQIKCFNVVDLWTKEAARYDFSQPETYSCLHFTQLVWKSSTKAGVGVARSSINGFFFISVVFDPPGNILGQFADNVFPS